MPKPDYKGAVKRLRKLLDEVEEKRKREGKAVRQKGQIVDVTKESSETAYQFTDFDLTVFKNEDVEDDGDEENK
ncbi:MAG: hypothetical protein QF765_02730 [Candidatus Marinimicrobia bacterium]|nr:hypothetical protein [Candidatus Neomarinimicrobiota bacterium]